MPQKQSKAREVTVAEVKRVWENTLNPTAYKVSQAFKKQGRAISHDVINRWRKANWEVEETATPFQAAVQDIEGSIGVLGEVTLDELVPPQIGVEFPNEHEMARPPGLRPPALLRITDNRAIVDFIDQGSDLELLRDTNRRAQGLFSVLCNEIDRQRDVLVPRQPTELASLINSLTNLLEAANRGAKHFLDVEERRMRVIDPNGQRGRGDIEPELLADSKKTFDFDAYAQSKPIQP